MALSRNPANPFDHNAIEVYNRAGEMIGYVPHPVAAFLVPIMASIKNLSHVVLTLVY